MKRLWLIIAALGLVAGISTGAWMVRVRSIASAEECIANLTRIESAMNQWALVSIARTNPGLVPSWPTDAHRMALVFAVLTNHAITNVIPRVDEFRGYLGGFLKMPRCPGGGTYSIGRIGEGPSCTVPRHNRALGALHFGVAESREPLFGATVEVTDDAGRKRTAVTDGEGLATVSTWPSRAVAVEISKLGYATVSNTVELLVLDENARVQLQRAYPEIETRQATAARRLGSDHVR